MWLNEWSFSSRQWLHVFVFDMRNMEKCQTYYGNVTEYQFKIEWMLHASTPWKFEQPWRAVLLLVLIGKSANLRYLVYVQCSLRLEVVLNATGNIFSFLLFLELHIWPPAPASMRVKHLLLRVFPIPLHMWTPGHWCSLHSNITSHSFSFLIFSLTSRVCCAKQITRIVISVFQF